MYYYLEDGTEILDGVAGLWCVNAGHKQVTCFAHSHSFGAVFVIYNDFINDFISVLVEKN